MSIYHRATRMVRSKLHTYSWCRSKLMFSVIVIRRSLSKREKDDYINAVICLQHLPASNPNDTISRSRFDEFQAYHIEVQDKVHLVALRNECAYRGANPYWNWSVDADRPEPDSISKSSMFDPDSGFGGDGVPGTYTLPDDPSGESRIVRQRFRGCISNGPFANFRPIRGPGKFIGEHCLTRGLNDTLKDSLTSIVVDGVLAQPDFERFRIELEGRPITTEASGHDGGHLAVGGEMSNIYSSPGDPIFFLHHANLDRIWYEWQHLAEGRLLEITGRSTRYPPYVNITLDYPLVMGTLGNTIPIRDIMDVSAVPGYWNWSIDADRLEPDSFLRSPVFDPDSGFGGDGVPGTYTIPDDPSGESRIFRERFRGCISNGPFAKFRPIRGPGKFIGEHCLTRGLNDTLSKNFLTSAVVDEIFAQPDFENFRIQLEGKPITPTSRIHDGGHISVGGEMSNVYSSPGGLSAILSTSRQPGPHLEPMAAFSRRSLMGDYRPLNTRSPIREYHVGLPFGYGYTGRHNYDPRYHEYSREPRVLHLRLNFESSKHRYCMRTINPVVKKVTVTLTIILPIFTLSLAQIAASAAILGPVSDFLESKEACTHTIYRQEWRSLSEQHKQEYIQAVKCSHSLPNKTSYHGVKTRLDDFQAVHIYNAEEVHHVGHFFPWHRRFLSMYETMLRDECGFRGAIPYWDWTLDADEGGRLLDSPIFDPHTGFGGDGVAGTLTLNLTHDEMDVNGIDPDLYRGCVMDGPFAYPQFTVHLGPGMLVGDHCLTRGINDSIITHGLNSNLVKRALNKSTFEQFRLALEEGNGDGSEHGAGHYAVGGEFANLYSSPAEPIFFLHHANLDRLWWNWQSLDLSARIIDVSGNDTHGQNVTLDYKLPFGQFNDDYTSIKHVMDVTQYPLCYDYI
ncbi:hypothetical protein CVT24_011963 [Panaeolus cyanescens]|uniref:Tyrosinase copper-binding domain-containing protein n=1 Tax=Panaeolus cyanescens TaxID=181874 RepID=A0A409VYZ7_9AGAR|nr:hypothetical protein CVT24_011963 [Panaeolus cyanescens]